MEQKTIIVMDEGVTTTARINHTTGVISAHPVFFTLHHIEQEFIIAHLKQRPACATKLKMVDKTADNNDLQNKLCADKTALQVMIARYPDKPLSYWPKMLENIFKKAGGFTIPEDYKRLDNL